MANLVSNTDNSRTVLELPIKTALANSATDRLLFIYNAANAAAAQTATMAANTFMTKMGSGVPYMAVVNGAVNGNITVTGIVVGDRLNEVLEYVYTTGNITDIVDLTDEFTISSNGIINNTDGTDTTDNKLVVRWTKLT